MKKYFTSFLVIIVIFNILIHPNLANTTNKSTNTIETVESFVIEVLSNTSNSEGIYELTGFKKVNSITEITENENKIYTKIIVVEDYYDIEGNYIETIVKMDEFENDYKTGKALHNFQEKKFNQPMTIKTGSHQNFLNGRFSIELSEAEKKQVKNNVLKYVEKLPEGKVKEIEGFTKTIIAKLKDMVQNIISNN